MRSLSSILAVVLVTPAFAQEPPKPKPGKAHKLFARDVGTWDCDVKMYFQGPDAAPDEFKGVETNKLVSGDLYLQSTFTCPMGDRGEFEGHSLMGYDPRTRKYIGTWVDNFTSVPSQFKAEFDEDGKTFTLHSTVVDESGNELPSRQITTWTDDSTRTTEIFLIIKAGDREINVKLMEMTARKRK